MQYTKKEPVYEALQYDGNNGQDIIDLVASLFPDFGPQFELQDGDLYTWIYWTGNLDPVPVGDWFYGSTHPNAIDNYGLLSNTAFQARFETV